MMLAEGGPVRPSLSIDFFSFHISLQVWSSYSVLNVLYSLMQKSKVNEYITAQRAGKSPEEISSVFFSLLLSRVDLVSVVRSSANSASVLSIACLVISVSLDYFAFTYTSEILHWL